MSKKQYKNQQPDILSTIVVGIFRMLWWVICLPFKGLGRKKGLTVTDRQFILARQDEIERNLKSSNIFELKHALIEADKLLDYVLEKKGFMGVTLADKLKAAQHSLSHENYNQLWQGHKIRNQVVHEHGYQISNSELRTAATKLLNYTKTL